jgi:adenine C2-methylase RlmN of 23S rRNA A2503 and tRNA A37
MPFHRNAPSVEEVYEELRTAAENGNKMILLHYDITNEGLDDDNNKQRLIDLATNFDRQVKLILSYYENGFHDVDFQETYFCKFLSEGELVSDIVDDWAEEIDG